MTDDYKKVEYLAACLDKLTDRQCDIYSDLAGALDATNVTYLIDYIDENIVMRAIRSVDSARTALTTLNSKSRLLLYKRKYGAYHNDTARK